ncbi:tRNA wybutosine-synthesizing protein 3 homolog isoform X1 [Schistocerca americana]|uniref:tRNA wybutosine-synthesizing protein 3 homolog isoform X1 n=1 Tax=Schistocerca americana TaxID=7009 RepID=UPI001F4FBC12|nr:tRNA wybutosine-synthesizing protein 3 homolog isoform X1 [Schistocerca americana]XP_046998301.1 tRNA wybutosine-synthesizing protein 3 homolog isoform X1 [Schistocerca americana]
MEWSEKEFQDKKKRILNSTDLSRKGSVDSDIVELVDFINSHNQYVTTSSCSGRLIVFCEVPSMGNSKEGCKWLYTTHDDIDMEDMMSKLDPTVGDLVLKFEPMILHVQCHSVEDAKHLHTCALESGFRNTGVTIGHRGKVMLAIRSCLNLEVPLSHAGKLLVSEEYLKFLTSKASEKMKENKRRTMNFFSKIKSIKEKEIVRTEVLNF